LVGRCQRFGETFTFEISGCHGGEYEDVYRDVAPCSLVKVLTKFQRHLLPQSSGRWVMMAAVSTSETSVNFYQTRRRNIPEDSHFHTVPFFSPKDGDSMFLWNGGIYLQVYTAPKPRTSSSSSPPWKSQISSLTPTFHHHPEDNTVRTLETATLKSTDPFHHCSLWCINSELRYSVLHYINIKYFILRQCNQL
jgi:hypothetical protein